MSHNVHVLMPNEDPEILAAVRRYVFPDRRYMKLHGWNIQHMNDQHRDDFGNSLAKAASQATDTELILLLNSDWRARLVAAWLIAMGEREEYRDLMKKLLLEGKGNNELKGFCFAITRFGTRADAEILSAYLSESLSPAHPLTAQEWALGGLFHLDERLGTSYASQFTGEHGPWKEWTGAEAGPDTEGLIDFLSGFSEAHHVSAPGERKTDSGNPLDAYSSWQSHRLPTSCKVTTSEAARTRIDSEVAELLDDYGLPHAEPLSVAACEICRAVLFNTRPGAGDWGIAKAIGRHGSRIEIFRSYADLREFLTKHEC
ncbi:DUF6000 family protein [Streptomyces sp. NPDC048595]|uniref:DUF6000 family protein n=1 Tax=Streptomyces sp. NPDC048595 TaxID=3365576 RepID=UPI0037165229